MKWKQNTAKTALIALLAVFAVTAAAAPTLAQAAEGTAPAELQIEQERYVSQAVEVISENGTRVYVVRGQYLEITPQNFNASAVTSFRVQESEAVLSYEKSDREYVLNNQGNAGTYHLFWTVSRNNETVVYEAAIRVVQADFSHVPAEQFTQIREKGARGQDIISRFEDAGDPDEPVSQKIDFAISVINFANNPFAALTGQFMALQTLRFMTPAGWLDLGITVLLFYALTRGLYGTLARLRKQLEKEEKVSRREDEQYIQMFKQLLAGQQMTDVDGIDDHQAAVLEDRLGKNLFAALHNFWTTFGEGSLKRMYVDAMGAVGYSARVTRNSAGEVQDVEVINPGGSRPTTDGGQSDATEFVNLSSAPGDVLEAITWEQVDDRVFQENPDISAMDHLMVANRAEPNDLISELNIKIPEDFQSRQNFMEAIGRFYNHIQETDFTDEENVPREERAHLNHITAFTTILEQEYGVPLDLYWRAAIWNAESLDRDDEARSVLDDITDAGTVVEDMDDRNGGGGPVGS